MIVTAEVVTVASKAERAEETEAMASGKALPAPRRRSALSKREETAARDATKTKKVSEETRIVSEEKDKFQTE